MSVVKCPSCGASVNVPEKKTGLWWGIGCLVAAMAIPFVVAVIGLLAAIAIPSFVKARDTARLQACVNNMRMLDAAKEQAAMERNYGNGDSVSEEEVSQYLREGFAGLRCPAAGRYAINPVGQEPECSVHGSLSRVVERRPAGPQDRWRTGDR